MEEKNMNRTLANWAAKHPIILPENDLGIFHDSELYSIQFVFSKTISVLLEIETGSFLDGDSSYLKLLDNQNDCLIQFDDVFSLEYKAGNQPYTPDSIEIFKIELLSGETSWEKSKKRCYIRLNSSSELKFEFSNVFVISKYAEGEIKP
jgi:hypothetical protein